MDESRIILPDEVEETIDSRRDARMDEDALAAIADVVRLAAIEQPEIEVVQGGNVLVDGQSTVDFGSTSVGTRTLGERVDGASGPCSVVMLTLLL